jgi:hypothetical protein
MLKEAIKKGIKEGLELSIAVGMMLFVIWVLYFLGLIMFYLLIK